MIYFVCEIKFCNFSKCNSIKSFCDLFNIFFFFFLLFFSFFSPFFSFFSFLHERDRPMLPLTLVSSFFFLNLSLPFFFYLHKSFRPVVDCKTRNFISLQLLSNSFSAFSAVNKKTCSGHKKYSHQTTAIVPPLTRIDRP